MTGRPLSVCQRCRSLDHDQISARGELKNALPVKNIILGKRSGDIRQHQEQSKNQTVGAGQSENRDRTQPGKERRKSAVGLRSGSVPPQQLRSELLFIQLPQTERALSSSARMTSFNWLRDANTDWFDWERCRRLGAITKGLPTFTGGQQESALPVPERCSTAYYYYNM